MRIPSFAGLTRLILHPACAVSVGISSQCLIAGPALHAQHPIMTSFRHANYSKALSTLDWIGAYDQLQEYELWWKQVADCAGVVLPENRSKSVQFYFVNAVDFAPLPSDKPPRMVVGVAYAASEQIYVSVFRIRSERIIKHEMIHQLLYWWGEPTWDDDARQEFKRCGVTMSGAS